MAKRKLPEIVVTDRNLRDIAQDALDALLAVREEHRLFIRAGKIARIAEDDTGNLRIEQLNRQGLRSILVRAINFVKETRNGPKPAKPDGDLLDDLLTGGPWKAAIPPSAPPFPSLDGLVFVPVLRPDGTVLSSPGYDKKTRLFLVKKDDLIPAVPDIPTQEDLNSALDVLKEVLQDFLHKDSADTVNAIALMLTPLVRPAITGCIPIALINARQAGIGKGLLANVVSIIATGERARIQVMSASEQEIDKRITSFLRDGTPIIVFDNLDRVLRSATLAAVVTSDTYKGRLLGKSEMPNLLQRATWIVIGNNIQLGGDIPRRTYLIDMVAVTSRPQERTGFKHENLLGYVEEHRGEIVAALLTLARAWFAAGQPPPTHCPPFGSFEEWRRIIAGILEFGGWGELLQNQHIIYDDADVEGQQWIDFLSELRDEFGDNPFTVKQILELVQTRSELREVLPDELEATLNSRKSVSRVFGNTFRTIKGKRFGNRNLRLVDTGNKAQRAVLWQVLEVS